MFDKATRNIRNTINKNEYNHKRMNPLKYIRIDQEELFGNKKGSYINENEIIIFKKKNIFILRIV